MAALATCAPGRAASDIQSSGRTNRAKTLPLNPLPFSPEGDITGFSGGALPSHPWPPEPIADAGAESVGFATTLEPVRLACEDIWPLAWAGRMIAVRIRRAA